MVAWMRYHLSVYVIADGQVRKIELQDYLSIFNDWDILFLYLIKNLAANNLEAESLHSRKITSL
jgi:hypothetical protein